MKVRILASMAMVVAMIGFYGCNKTEESKGHPLKSASEPDGKENSTASAENGHGWWCDEHGVKEAECSMCNAKVAKECQDKGDWCKEHNRAKSQCFICNPDLKEKYAADYRAKYGKEPPEPEGQKPEKQ
jgi:hypothetical protein